MRDGLGRTHHHEVALMLLGLNRAILWILVKMSREEDSHQTSAVQQIETTRQTTRPTDLEDQEAPDNSMPMTCLLGQLTACDLHNPDLNGVLVHFKIRHDLLRCIRMRAMDVSQLRTAFRQVQLRALRTIDR